MDPVAMSRICKKMIDLVSQYWQLLQSEKSYSCFHKQFSMSIVTEIPEQPSRNPVSEDELINQIKLLIMPQLHHWQSPLYFAYFPANTSYASMAAEILVSAIGGVSFGWASNPAFVDLEEKMIAWLAYSIGLPSIFTEGKGGGALHLAASESTLLSFVLAKKRLSKKRPLLSRINRFVAYTSELAHCSVEKTSVMLDIDLVMVKVDSQFRMTGPELEKEVQKSRRYGKLPLIVVATLGTTSLCSLDDLESIGIICNRYGIWFHVDAAYAGCALICPEFRKIARGIELADSFSFNLHKRQNEVEKITLCSDP
ncbi:hypothetical protein ACOME3_000373 [Neoechinorhynchus agilis]